MNSVLGARVCLMIRKTCKNHYEFTRGKLKENMNVDCIFKLYILG